MGQCPEHQRSAALVGPDHIGLRRAGHQYRFRSPRGQRIARSEPLRGYRSKVTDGLYAAVAAGKAQCRANPANTHSRQAHPECCEHNARRVASLKR
jgi:hypothetical protein